MKRRTSYHVVSLIIPIIAVFFLISLVFILPHDSGERVGFSTTVLLSIIVYLIMIQDLLPESSEPNISALGYVLVTYVVNGSFVVAEVIITFRFHRKSDENPVPRCLRFIVIFFDEREGKMSSLNQLVHYLIHYVLLSHCSYSLCQLSYICELWLHNICLSKKCISLCWLIVLHIYTLNICFIHCSVLID